MASSAASAFLLFLVCLLVISNLGVGVADMWIGTRNLSNCTVESLLPIALIVDGAMLALLALLGIFDAVRVNNRRGECPKETERLTGGGTASRVEPWTKCFEVICWLINTIAVAWATLTIYLAVRTNSAYSSTPSSASYCDPDLVLSAIILASISLGNVVVLTVVNASSYITYC